jgi:hypothetical protein
MLATTPLFPGPNIWAALTTRQIHLLHIGRSESLQRYARPHALSATNIESVLDLHVWGVLNVRERNIHCADLLLAVEESNVEALRPRLCRNGYAEVLVERWVVDVGSRSICLDSGLECVLATPCYLHARLELLALALDTISTGYQDRGNAAHASITRVTGRGEALATISLQLEVLGRNQDFASAALALGLQCKLLPATIPQNLLDCGHTQANLVIAVDIFVENVHLDALEEITDHEVVRLVPGGVGSVVLGSGLPHGLSTKFDFGVAIGCRASQFGEKLLGFARGLFGEARRLLDSDAHDANWWEVCLEVVVLGVKCHQEAVGQGSHAIDDGENHASHSTVDGREVSDIGGTGEVKLEMWWVDKSDLGSADQGNDVGQRS